MEKQELDKILGKHQLWLADEEGGERADFSGVNLNAAHLSGANLDKANLRGANLCGANLCGADLYKADLYKADLCGADLRGADLDKANLRGADLCGANLCGAILTGAILSDVKCNVNTAFFALQCPEKGSFIAWKKCRNDVIVKLMIPEDAERSSATSRKCRASKAVVLEVVGAEKGISQYAEDMVYEVGKTIEPDSFDKDRWNESSHGIHFFLTREEAECY